MPYQSLKNTIDYDMLNKVSNNKYKKFSFVSIRFSFFLYLLSVWTSIYYFRNWRSVHALLIIIPNHYLPQLLNVSCVVGKRVLSVIKCTLMVMGELVKDIKCYGCTELQVFKNLYHLTPQLWLCTLCFIYRIIKKCNFKTISTDYQLPAFWIFH